MQGFMNVKFEFMSNCCGHDQLNYVTQYTLSQNTKFSL